MKFWLKQCPFNRAINVKFKQKMSDIRGWSTDIVYKKLHSERFQQFINAEHK